MQLTKYQGAVGTTLDSAERYLAGRKREYIDCPVSDLLIDEVTGDVRRGDYNYGITSHAVKGLAWRTKVPYTFIAHAPTDIVARTMNYFLPNAHGSVRLAVEQQGTKNVIVGAMPQTKSPVQSRRLVERMQDVAGDYDLENWVLDERGLVLRFSSPSLVVEPRVGDIVKAGVNLYDHENDNESIDMMAQLFRLVCGNGQTVPDRVFADRVAKEAWRDPEQIIALATHLVADTVRDARAFGEGLPHLTEHPIEVPDDQEELDFVLKHGPMKLLGVPTKFTTSLADALRGEESTLYGLYNANTRLGRDAVERSVRDRFERAGFLTVVKADELAPAWAEAQHAD